MLLYIHLILLHMDPAVLQHLYDFIACNQMEGILEVGSGGQCPLGGRPYHDNSGLSWTVSAPVKGIAESVEKDMAPYRHWSLLLWWDPNDVPHRRILPSYEAERWSVPASLCWWCGYCLARWSVPASLCWWCGYCLADQLWVLIAYTRRRTACNKPRLHRGWCPVWGRHQHSLLLQVSCKWEQ